MTDWQILQIGVALIGIVSFIAGLMVRSRITEQINVAGTDTNTSIASLGVWLRIVYTLTIGCATFFSGTLGATMGVLLILLIPIHAATEE